MFTRLVHRALWHWRGLLLWLIQRPYLRYAPCPLPSVTTVPEWHQQVDSMVARGSWPHRWQARINIGTLCTAVHLKEATHLRDRMGLRLSFLEDEVIMFGLKALQKKHRKQIREAAAMEAQRLLSLGKQERTMQLRALLGPKGGLPRLKEELQKAAALLNTPLSPTATVDEIRKLLQPIVKD